jgi:nitroreductase/NAD-dependent dihydropyrimidine dehydrogenase PreA subunit
MSLLHVDSQKCRRDGVCIAECPARIIEFQPDGGFPALVAGGAALCIHCGHCVAVCPHGAMTHSAIPMADCPPLERSRLPDAAQVAHFLRARRSTRAYKSAVLPRETITGLIELARYAPSGHNRQPVGWLVIHDPATVRQLAGHVADWMRHLIAEGAPLAAALHVDRVVAAWERGEDRICRGAPHVVVAHALQDDPTAPAAATIALAHLELAAASQGLGACWAGYFHAASLFWPALGTALALPKGQAPLGAMLLGIPRFTYHRLPPRPAPQIAWR